jgi:hypothetical protein
MIVNRGIIMKKIKYFGLVFVLLFCCTAYCITPDKNINSKEAAFEILETYCAQEFKYNESIDRDALFTTTKAYDKENTDQDDDGCGSGQYPGGLYIDSDKIFLVRSYKILSVTFDENDKNKAIATVSYDVLAKRDSWPKKDDGYDGIHEYKNPNYIEKINMIYDGKTWRILNPPPAKISIDEVLGIYAKELQITETNKGDDLDSQQLRNYYHFLNTEKQIVELLKNLGGDASKATNILAKKN